MICSAAFNDNKLILTPVDLSPLKLKTPGPVEINLKDADSQLGAFVSVPGFDKFFNLIRKNGSDSIGRLDLENAKKHLPNFVEIESIDCTLPFKIVFGDDRKKSKQFIHNALTKVATGQTTANAYKSRALINPLAIGSVEDKGAYRVINLKAAFSVSASAIKTALSETQIQAIAKPGSSLTP